MSSVLLVAAIVSASTTSAPAGSANGGASSGLFRKLDANGNGRLVAAELESTHRPLFDRMLATSDADGDGELSATEFADALAPRRPVKPAIEKQGSRLPRADALLVITAKLDANRDRVIEVSEAPPRLRLVARQMIAAGDKNGDKKLDRFELSRSGNLAGIADRAARRLQLDVAAEAAKLPQKLVAELDPANVEVATRQRLTDPAQAKQLFRRLDSNGDGYIVRDEIPEPLVARLGRNFRRADRDGDQQVSEAEFLQMAGKLAKFSRNVENPARISETGSRDQ